MLTLILLALAALFIGMSITPRLTIDAHYRATPESGFWGAIGGAAVSVIGGALLSNSGSGGSSAGSAIGGAVGGAMAYSPQQFQQMIQTADPFGAQRGQYQGQLSQLMANPNSVTNTPGYQFQMNQGTQAIDRNAAANGQLGSGNQGAALASFGQGLAGNEYQQQMSNLMQLSGANINGSATAANLMSQQQQQQMQGGANIGSSVGGALGGALGNYMTGGSNLPTAPDTSGGYGWQSGGNSTVNSGAVPSWAMGGGSSSFSGGMMG